MKGTLIVVVFAVLATGCISIPKPDWVPGNQAPAPQMAQTGCPLPAEWVWNAQHRQWVCVPSRPVYYGYPVYPQYYIQRQIWYGPVVPWPYHR